MPIKKEKKIAELGELEREYRAITSIAEGYCGELSNQLTRLLAVNGVTLGFPIQHRVKGWDSLCEKLDRVPMEIKSVKDMQDLVGLRVILLFRRDVAKVVDIIPNNFKVVHKYDTRDRLKEDQFGYSSIHFVVELLDKWLAVPTLAPFGGLKAEIQVRTLAQHIWAEASHALQYKQEGSVPGSLLRAVYRVSAILETIDLEFERVLEERESYRSTLDRSSLEALGTDKKADETLNVDLLEKTLDLLLPADHKKSSEAYASLLEDLGHFGINTAHDLKALILGHLKEALEIDLRRVERVKADLSEGKPVSSSMEDRIKRGVYFSHVGLVRRCLNRKYGKAWLNYLAKKAMERALRRRGSSKERNKRN